MRIFTLSIALFFLGITLTTAQTSRLIAATTYDSIIFSTHFSFGPVDSETYLYTNGRTGDLTHILEYTSSHDYQLVYQNLAYDSGVIYSQTFDGSNNIITQLAQVWSNYHNAYINSTNNHYYYDADNNDTATILSNWDTIKSAWVNNEKNVMQFDANHNTTLNETLNWNSTNSTWAPGGLTLNGFDANNNISFTKNAYWNVNLWDTDYSYKYINKYNTANQDTLVMLLNYNFSNSVWDSISKTIYVYNAHNAGDSLKTVEYFNTQNWYISTRDVYVYDNNGNKICDSLQRDNGVALYTTHIYKYTYNGDNQCTTNLNYYFDGTKLYIIRSFYYYYSNKATGVNPLATGDALSVYPNPSNGLIHLTLTLPQMQPVQLSLYNLQGQQVWSADMGSAAKVDATIPVTNLPGGTYVLKVISGNTVQQKEIIVGR